MRRDRPYQYVLDGRNPVPCDDLLDWARVVESGRTHHVDLTIVDDVSVSTVFLFLDHNWNFEGPPVLFETMVFGGKLDKERARYSTYDEAELGHAMMVARVVAVRDAQAGVRGERIGGDG